MVLEGEGVKQRKPNKKIRGASKGLIFIIKGGGGEAGKQIRGVSKGQASAHFFCLGGALLRWGQAPPQLFSGGPFQPQGGGPLQDKFQY